jgi:Ca2+-binding RTX toxin-like protein
MGGAGWDTLINIENLRGSAFDDTLISNGNSSVLEGGPGNDTLIGPPGGNETVSYEHAPGPVTVDLSVTGPQDTISGYDFKFRSCARLGLQRYADR